VRNRADAAPGGRGPKCDAVHRAGPPAPVLGEGTAMGCGHEIVEPWPRTPLLPCKTFAMVLAAKPMPFPNHPNPPCIHQTAEVDAGLIDMPALTKCWDFQGRLFRKTGTGQGSLTWTTQNASSGSRRPFSTMSKDTAQPILHERHCAPQNQRTVVTLRARRRRAIRPGTSGAGVDRQHETLEPRTPNTLRNA
jgi:hypothetical protein